MRSKKSKYYKYLTKLKRRQLVKSPDLVLASVISFRYSLGCNWKKSRKSCSFKSRKSRMCRGAVEAQARYLRCCYCRADVIIGHVENIGTRGGIWRLYGDGKRTGEQESQSQATWTRDRLGEPERRENTEQFLSARRTDPTCFYYVAVTRCLERTHSHYVSSPPSPPCFFS